MTVMDTVFVSKSGVAHTVNCPVVTRMLAPIGTPTARREITREEGLAGIKSGKYTECKQCAKIEAANAARTAAQAAIAAEAEAATQALEAETAAPVEQAPADETAETPAEEVKDPKTAAQQLADRVDAAHAAADAKKTGRKPASIKPRQPKKAAQATPAAETTPSNEDIEKAAAELSAEAQAEPTAQTVIDFVLDAVKANKLTAVRAKNLTGCFKYVLKTTGTALDTKVSDIDADALVTAFNAATPTLLDGSRRQYTGDFQRVLRLYTEGLDAARRSGARRARQESQEFTLTDGSVLRVTHTPGVDLKAALEAALESLTEAQTAKSE